MAEAPAQLNEQNDDPHIGNEVVAAPVDEPIGISINTGNLFLNAALYNDRDELIDWCRQVALKAGFSMVIDKSDKGNGDRRKPSHWRYPSQ
jgi:hypothetical protein